MCGTYLLASRVCKERSDGIAIVRTFQPPLHLSKPQVRNRVTCDPSEAKACDRQKKDINQCDVFFLSIQYEIAVTWLSGSTPLILNIFPK